MELMAPVGSKEALKAAIIGGANAVYLGGKFFGARGLAENFTDSDLAAAIRLAHKHRVKIYVTVNTLIKETELQHVFSYLDYLESLKADGVIVQDRGLLNLIRDNFSIPIHASTQMGIHSPEGAIWAEKNGLRRIILARELQLEELKKIRRATKLELEVFIHGALCYSFSGRCLFSSMLAGKSGNRGFCLQPCRKEYTLGMKQGYLLSTADVFGIESIPDLLRIGIDGLKIEGRMRSPLYVYLTSRIYSKAIQRAEREEATLITDREKELLEVVFNRGFTRSYLSEGRAIMQTIYPGSRGLFLGRTNFAEETFRIKAKGLHMNDGITLYKDNKKIGGFEIRKIEEEEGDLILSPPFEIPKGDYEIYKTKDRVFDSIQREILEMEFPLEDGVRRHVKYSIKSIKRKKKKSELSFYLSTLKSLEKVLPYADRVYFEWNNDIEEASMICKKSGIECVLILPSLSFDSSGTDAESLMINSVDQYERYLNRKLYGHYFMNFFNSRTIPKLYQSTLSVELSKDDIERVASQYSGKLEVMVFGRIELMISRDTSLDKGVLVDQKNARFPLHRDRFGFTHIFNSSDLCLLDYLDDLENSGIDSLGIDLRWREPELAGIVAKSFFDRDLNKKKIIKRKCGSITARHFTRGVV